MNLHYLYPIAASILIGLRMVSYKAMVLGTKYYYLLFAFVIFTIIFSQYFIYKGMEYIENPAIVHLIVYASVFITFFAAVFVFKINNFDPYPFLLGLILILSGLYFINASYD
tara:strand:- start:369 stop:704 length:336 start_codon:yes stop_codon:yes gene_type:complete